MSYSLNESNKYSHPVFSRVIITRSGTISLGAYHNFTTLNARKNIEIYITSIKHILAEMSFFMAAFGTWLTECQLSARKWELFHS